MKSGLDRMQDHWDNLSPEDCSSGFSKDLYDSLPDIEDGKEATEILIRELFRGEAILDHEIIWKSLMVLARDYGIEKKTMIERDENLEYQYKYLPEDLSIVSSRQFNVFKRNMENKEKDIKKFLYRHLTAIKQQIYGEEELDKNKLDFAITNISWIIDQQNDHTRRINLIRKS
jgi:hypothetical protein